jgi:RNA polymerase sigma-70 factor (ECF subfamily)
VNLNSQEFIESLKQRDPLAFHHLIEQYQLPLYKAALKLKLGMDQAEEVVQATWATFFEQAERFEGRSHIRTYLFGILYNKIKELWRNNKKYTQEYDSESIDRLFLADGHYKTPPQSPDAWAESQELLQIILSILEELPDNQRLAFTLKEIEGEATEDICNIMDVTVTNLGVLIFRAKTNIRLKLEKKYETDA